MSDTVGAIVSEEFVSTVLLKIEDRKDKMIKIKNHTVQKASSTGDNYLSFVLRVAVEYSVGDKDDDDLRKLSFIVKLPHKSEAFVQMFKKIYEKEHYIYADLLPKVYNLLQTDKHFSPRLLYSDRSHTLVFDDLKACDYVMVDKCKMLDFDHSALCLTALARFHAANVVLVEKHPDILDRLASEFMYSEEKKQLNKETIKVILQAFVNAVESWNVFENFKARTERFLYTIVDEMIRLVKPREKSLNVVNHGDTWSNNMLFKYDDSGRPVRVKLIDFQMSRYTSPAMDLQNFLFISANDDVMDSRLTELLNVYLGALNGQLEELGSAQRLSLQELEQERRASYPYVFTIVYSQLPFVFTEQETTIDFSNYDEESFKLSTEDIYELSYSSKNYKPRAIRVLKFLEREGFI